MRPEATELRIFLEPLQALFDHDKITQDQLRLHVFQVADRTDRAFLVGHGIALE